MIYTCAEDLNSLEGWVKYYCDHGREYLRDALDLPSDLRARQRHLREYLTQHIDLFISWRADALRESSAYRITIAGATAAGLIPFGKLLVKKSGAFWFLQEALEGFGLDNQEALRQLLWETAVAAGVIEVSPLKIFASKVRSEVLHLLKDEAKDYLIHEGFKDAFEEALVSELGDHAVEEIVHFLPLLGHIWSCGRGGVKARETLEKTLRVVMDKARFLHEDIIVFAATEQLM
jgi:hypothetical protein